VSRDSRGGWNEAAKLLAVDPTLRVRCPTKDDGDLLVHDVPFKEDSAGLERYLVCEVCGARNVLLMKRRDAPSTT
jgi:hypothetical protein